MHRARFSLGQGTDSYGEVPEGETAPASHEEVWCSLNWWRVRAEGEKKKKNLIDSLQTEKETILATLRQEAHYPIIDRQRRAPAETRLLKSKLMHPLVNSKQELCLLISSQSV